MLYLFSSLQKYFKISVWPLQQQSPCTVLEWNVFLSHLMDKKGSRLMNNEEQAVADREREGMGGWVGGVVINCGGLRSPLPPSTPV